MRVIIVPNGTGPKPHKCFNLTPWLVCASLLLLVLPVILGIGAYRIAATVDDLHRPTTMVAAPKQALARFQASLAAEKRKIDEARSEVASHLDAMGQRLGRLQAQFARVDALGQRLTDMAELDPTEFNFAQEPGLGGPELATVSERSLEKDLAGVLDGLEFSLREKQEELEILEGLLTDHRLQTRQFPRGWPVDGGWISSSFGYRNDPFTGRRAFHMVEINHGNGYATRYAHALAKMVDVGERVDKGQVVAVVGNSGRSTGAHLHFEVERHGRNVNPGKYLRAKL